VTEVPEHLLRRSRERREALGLATGDEGAPTAAPSPATPPSAEAPAAAAAVPATVEAAPPPAVVEPEAPPPPYVVAARTRSHIPRWAVPVLAALPLWAFLYAATIDPNTGKTAPTGPLADGAALFASNCAACHGATGGGGVGPQLSGGEVLKTFPAYADHIAWVTNGSSLVKGNGYGDPNRPGGQHVAKTGGMPSFKSQLTAQQIAEVVLHERVTLSGGPVDPALFALASGGASGTGGTGTGH
jgi:mono/diheme cytochrome c family protein